ncbi:glycoside hydrolase [Coprinopsis marcescibilis]|uniref:lytic cellulose monooxygenase (C4-dehydrogenating) n=1 Tax=Coprinopsis marcescibilis TaxID=230819 RepID=A0A5C3KZP6_COPMA|nr:glycoside hydrolase [Coprinopsis marcescibilis]
MFGLNALKTLIPAIIAIISVASTVDAHGYSQEVILGTVKHTGSLPYQDPYMSPYPDRIIRKIPSNGPVEDPSLIDVQCNGYAAAGWKTAPSSIVGKIKAGDTIKFHWTDWADSHKGPIITYMARAPSDITKWEPGTAPVWFKIDHSGKSADGKWAATDKLYETNHIYTVRIPPKLQAGQYLIRHEIIALHGAFNFPGAQFYPGCVQVQVEGTGTAFPSKSSLVSFPGAYNASTPGILFDIYSDQSLAYPIPGPPVWTGGN